MDTASPDIPAFLQRPHGLLIDGTWLPPGERSRIAVINPASGEEIAGIAEATRDDVDHAVAAARAALAGWSAMLPSARARLLWKIADAIEMHAEELAALECLDNGKPLTAARRGDIPGAVETFRYFAGWCTKISGQTLDVSRPGQPFAYTLREPVGVVAAIIPWNFPLLMAAWKLAPALAAGCTVVLKPAEETSLTALRLGELLLACGCPKGVVNILTGHGATVGAALVAHPDVDKVAFTGSTEVGKAIVQAAAGNLKKLTLELGGKSPTVILADADLDLAIPAAAAGIFFNAGQICAAGSRLFVHESIFSNVMDGIAAIAGKLRIGPGSQADTDLGPLISGRHRQRVHRYVDEAARAGATILCGGAACEGPGYFYQPTIVLDAADNLSIVQEEVFGPVLVASPFSDEDDMLKRANGTIYGLSATLWTSSLSSAHRLTRRLQAGSIRVNAGGGTDPNLPFGGYKQSGWGREFGEEGLMPYLQTKSVMMAI